MRRISPKVMWTLEASPYHGTCLRRLLLEDHQCEGRMTLEHALLYGGRQMDEPFAIIGLCSLAHSIGPWMDTGILDKEINEWIAVNRMTEEDMDRYPKVNWRQKKAYLNDKYGEPHVPTL